MAEIQQVVLVLELIAEAVGSLGSFVVQFIRFIRICIRIWTIWTARRAAVGNGDPERQPATMAEIQQVVLVLELIAEAVGSLGSFLVQFIRFIRICIRIWTIWTARQAAVGNGDQDDITLAGNDEADADADCEL